MEVFEKGDLSMSYYVEGQGQDVLLLHGFPDTSAIWAEQVSKLRSMEL